MRPVHTCCAFKIEKHARAQPRIPTGGERTPVSRPLATVRLKKTRIFTVRRVCIFMLASVPQPRRCPPGVDAQNADEQGQVHSELDHRWRRVRAPPLRAPASTGGAPGGCCQYRFFRAPCAGEPESPTPRCGMALNSGLRSPRALANVQRFCMHMWNQFRVCFRTQ